MATKKVVTEKCDRCDGTGKVEAVKNIKPKPSTIEDVSASNEFDSIESILRASTLHYWTEAKLGRTIKRHIQYLLSLAKNNECTSCDMEFSSDSTKTLEYYNVGVLHGNVVHRDCDNSKWYKTSEINKVISKAILSHDKTVASKPVR